MFNMRLGIIAGYMQGDVPERALQVMLDAAMTPIVAAMLDGAFARRRRLFSPP